MGRPAEPPAEVHPQEQAEKLKAIEKITALARKAYTVNPAKQPQGSEGLLAVENVTLEKLKKEAESYKIGKKEKVMLVLVKNLKQALAWKLSASQKYAQIHKPHTTAVRDRRSAQAHLRGHLPTAQALPLVLTGLHHTHRTASV